MNVLLPLLAAILVMLALTAASPFLYHLLAASGGRSGAGLAQHAAPATASQ